MWDWSLAILGAVYAAPATALMFSEPTKGLALAVGVLPAAASGIPGPRRARVLTIVLGVLIGASMTLGAILAQLPIVAVPAIFSLSVGAALLAPRGKLGRLGLGLCLPLVGIGLSFSDTRGSGRTRPVDDYRIHLCLGGVAALAQQTSPTPPRSPPR